MDLYKINFHAHSRYSDGNNTIEEMAQMYKNLGFCCAVLTDHYYSTPDLAGYSLNPESYQKQREEAEKVSKKLNFPVIIGAECCFYGGMEEIVVFGKEAILWLMQNGTSTIDYQYVRDNFKCAMSLNHPSLSQSLKEGVHTIIDGFEAFNHGQNFFKGEQYNQQHQHRKVPEEFKNIHAYSNSDAHSITGLDCGYNLIDRNVQSEDELIDFLRNGNGPVHLSANGRIKKVGDY